MLTSSYLDNYYALRFIYILTREWKDTDAFKMGIINDKGEQIKKREDLTSDEKEAYTRFHMLVFNIKRMLEKLPLGKTTVARYSTALYLIKEEIDEKIQNKNIIQETFKDYVNEYITLTEDKQEIINFLLLNEEGESATSCTNTTSGIDMVDGKLNNNMVKRKTVDEDEEYFAGHRVFKCDSDTFHNCRLGKTRYAKYKTFVGDDEIGQKIRDYGRSNPSKGIILKDSTSGVMLFLKRHKQNL